MSQRCRGSQEVRRPAGVKRGCFDHDHVRVCLGVAKKEGLLSGRGRAEKMPPSKNTCLLERSVMIHDTVRYWNAGGSGSGSGSASGSG